MQNRSVEKVMIIMWKQYLLVVWLLELACKHLDPCGAHQRRDRHSGRLHTLDERLHHEINVET